MVIITKLQVAPVELVVSSESSCAVRLARHSQNAARHVERVESCRVESRRAKWNLGFCCRGIAGPFAGDDGQQE